jgi:hypothetical protein
MNKDEPTTKPADTSSRPALIATVAILFLAFVAVGVYTWITLSDSELTVNGDVALVLGILGTVALGAGLMGLVFFSNRHGYDDKVGGRGTSQKRD